MEITKELLKQKTEEQLRNLIIFLSEENSPLSTKGDKDALIEKVLTFGAGQKSSSSPKRSNAPSKIHTEVKITDKDGELLLTGPEKFTLYNKSTWKSMGARWDPKETGWVFSKEKKEELENKVKELHKDQEKKEEEDNKTEIKLIPYGNSLVLVGPESFTKKFKDVWSKEFDGKWNSKLKSDPFKGWIFHSSRKEKLEARIKELQDDM